MCGIFGIVSSQEVSNIDLKTLAVYARQRGRDSSGFVFKTLGRDVLDVSRADIDILKHFKEISIDKAVFGFGHSRLVTNGLRDNQPVVSNDLAVLHNGIITNHEALWAELKSQRELQIDTEVINGIAQDGMH